MAFSQSGLLIYFCSIQELLSFVQIKEIDPAFQSAAARSMPLYFHWMFFISDDVPFQLVARIHFLSREPAAQAGPNLEVMELIRAERGP